MDCNTASPATSRISVSFCLLLSSVSMFIALCCALARFIFTQSYHNPLFLLAGCDKTRFCHRTVTPHRRATISGFPWIGMSGVIHRYWCVLLLCSICICAILPQPHCFSCLPLIKPDNICGLHHRMAEQPVDDVRGLECVTYCFCQNFGVCVCFLFAHSCKNNLCSRYLGICSSFSVFICAFT